MIPANGQRCLAAGKVTVYLASHWPRVTDISGSPPTGSRPGRGRRAPAYVLLWSIVNLPLPYLSTLCQKARQGGSDATSSIVERRRRVPAAERGHERYVSVLSAQAETIVVPDIQVQRPIGLALWIIIIIIICAIIIGIFLLCLIMLLLWKV